MAGHITDLDQIRDHHPRRTYGRDHLAGMFLLLTVGTVALYAPDIRIFPVRRHDLEPPDDPGLGRP